MPALLDTDLRQTMDSKLGALAHDDRMRLLRFVCSFAWADLEIQPSERAFIMDLVVKLGVDEEERETVNEWLQTPPLPEEVDPMEIPVEHRQLFLNTILKIMMVCKNQGLNACGITFVTEYFDQIGGGKIRSSGARRSADAETFVFKSY